MTFCLHVYSGGFKIHKNFYLNSQKVYFCQINKTFIKAKIIWKKITSLNIQQQKNFEFKS